MIAGGKSFRRAVARRVFAFELNNATYRIESGDKAIQLLLPTGVACSRIFLVGVLLDKEETRPDSDFWKVKFSDPTGVFRGFVGRFQPDALETLLKIEPPEIVAVVSKIRLFEGETATLVTVRPEIIVPVEREVRDYWIVETAKHTLSRIENMKKGGDELVELAWRVYNPDLDAYEEKTKEVVKTVLEQHSVIEVKSEGDEETVEEELAVKTEKEREEVEDLEISDLDEFEFEEEEWDLSDILED
ncbi:MAG: hypothetical protein DSY33_00045 [Archaeoglobus sp.]|nr:MAG: hypothetical protein DSY33_00045 [Archaeoglobus sp.]